VNCPGTTSVLSGYIYLNVLGVKQPFPSGLVGAGLPTGRGQWTFFVRNTGFSGFTGTFDAGVVCAIAN